jgi:hypothetical protein
MKNHVFTVTITKDENRILTYYSKIEQDSEFTYYELLGCIELLKNQLMQHSIERAKIKTSTKEEAHGGVPFSELP